MRKREFSESCPDLDLNIVFDGNYFRINFKISESKNEFVTREKFFVLSPYFLREIVLFFKVTFFQL